MEYKIYKLIKDYQVIYVGLTSKSLEERKSGGYKHIPKDLLAQLKIELIEETTDRSREKYWIDKYLNDGANLINMIGGVDGLTNIERSRIWHLKNSEKSLETRKLYREANREKLLVDKKEWHRKRKLVNAQ